MHLLYGGGNLGMMGAISKAVQDGGGHVLGIIPRPLANEQLIGTTNGDEMIGNSLVCLLSLKLNPSILFLF